MTSDDLDSLKIEDLICFRINRTHPEHLFEMCLVFKLDVVTICIKALR